MVSYFSSNSPHD